MYDFVLLTLVSVSVLMLLPEPGVYLLLVSDRELMGRDLNGVGLGLG